MIKVFGYELKRLLTSGLFIAMLLVNGVFAWYILTTEIIEGIAYTAPFSVWSGCAYTGKTLPLSIITILLLQAGYYGKRQKQVEILISSSPVTYGQTVLIRTAALGVSFLIICLVQGILEIIFFSVFFGYYDFWRFIIPVILEIVPCFVLCTGFGHLAGRFHCGLVYALLPVAFILGYMGISGAFDFFGNGFFSSYPLMLPVGQSGEPDFAMSSVRLTARLIYLLAGIGIIAADIIIPPKIKRA